MSADPSPVVLLEFPAADVALLRLNRPQARNALNDEVRQRLASHFQTLGADPAIRVIVLTGDSRCFAAGADLRDLSTSTAIGLYGRHSERYWEAIARCPKPVIAAVNGFALGGGCELAMHCDLIVAGESAQFAQPEIKVGVMPGAGGTQRLVRAVGKFQALRMLFTGCLVKAPQALAMGLVSEVVADESTLARALELAMEIARLPLWRWRRSRRWSWPVPTCRWTVPWPWNARRSSCCSTRRTRRKACRPSWRNARRTTRGNRRCPIFVVSPWSVPVRWAPGSPRSPPRPA